MLKLGHFLLLILGVCAVLPFGSSSLRRGGQGPGSSTGPYNPNPPRPSPLGRYARHAVPSASLVKENRISRPGTYCGINQKCQDFKQIEPVFLRRLTRDLLTEKSDNTKVHDCIGKPPCRTTQPLIDYGPSQPVFTENKNVRQKRFAVVDTGDYDPRYDPYSSPDP
ncbi:uncharacterized protein LOC142329408 [Lycorma delicatula]|uniref:uncharacterized protein LOC142329408 n=1 Tax=Lycorma delicatula TaxID=130591 RepID=UPI003F51794B